MDLELGGKHALITGGSKGIGRATAEAFLAEGARVTLVARDPDRLEETCAALDAQAPGRVAVRAADLSLAADREALAEDVPDVLVNNAGAIRAGRLRDLTIDQIQQDWALKVFGYIHLCQIFQPKMAERGSGTIVNIIGMGGRANRASYISGAAANAALIGFTHALGAEAQAEGLRVFGINPSPTLTDRMTEMMKRRAAAEWGDESRWREKMDPARFPYGRPANPEEIAALAVMLASPKVTYLNGTVIDMDGGGQWTGS
ncbi:short-chain dehydrogenase/reductase [Jannaschia formosa]|uniref:short-chain dehydrogenase/reductase n=1 Tax=Jannaschia formosa TaxID=2259592 RepID=UPI000E1B5BE3|nr:short-chain dehydrogenase/reductase [Jannaschia formosa]TFL16520.1 SDR family NAD(P)-dependent oxidoreductase [Jannaschia formosa]